MMRGAAGMLAVALALLGAMVLGCSPRTRGAGDEMGEAALRERAAEAMAQHAPVEIVLLSGESVHGEIGGVAENGLVLVQTDDDGGRPCERTLTWPDVRSIAVEEPLGNASRLLVLGLLFGGLAAFAAAGRGVSGF